MAYPVVPPSDTPIRNTRHETRYGPNGPIGMSAATALEENAPTTNTNTNVAIISLVTLFAMLLIAGDVQKQARLTSGSGVSRQCGKKCIHTSVAPAKAPASCAAAYGMTLAKLPDWMAKAIVMAG